MPEISYEDFAKLDIRIGTVIAAEMVPETDKLIKCAVDFGELGERTIVSGIAEWKKPEDLVGKQLPYIVNLTPRILRGVRFTIYGSCFPTRSSGFFHSAIPDTIVRSPSSPKSTAHLMSLSVSGTISAAITVPIRMSSLAKSS